MKRAALLPALLLGSINGGIITLAVLIARIIITTTTTTTTALRVLSSIHQNRRRRRRLRRRRRRITHQPKLLKIPANVPVLEPSVKRRQTRESRDENEIRFWMVDRAHLFRSHGNGNRYHARPLLFFFVIHLFFKGVKFLSLFCVFHHSSPLRARARERTQKSFLRYECIYVFIVIVVRRIT